MEYGLWRQSRVLALTLRLVLILVLMEYGLWPAQGLLHTSAPTRLNPCSNGIWSLTVVTVIVTLKYFWVLILVLMEYGLWRLDEHCTSVVKPVLILVLMEYGLWPPIAKVVKSIELGLNPCSNGIWSLTCRCQACRNRACRLNPCSNGIWSLTSAGVTTYFSPHSS